MIQSLRPSTLATARRGFSLVELVVVVVILGIIAAIAIPRMSRGAAGASDAGLAADLAILRGAISLYAAEHNGDFPSASNIEDQLTQYTDDQGNTNAAKTGEFIFGPYLNSIPPLKVGAARGNTDIAASAGADVGWIYDETSGTIRAATTSEMDDSGRLYSEY